MTALTLNPVPDARLSALTTVADASARAAPADPAAALTRRLAEGDEAAFREFHAQYFDRLYLFLLGVARGREHEAREAAQETLVRVARHARAFESEEAFWSWLRAVARNVARDAGRRRTRYAGLLQGFLAATAPAAALARARDDQPLRAALDDALRALAPEDGALVTGKYLEGRSVRELAAQTGLSESAVESRLARLRRGLRERVLKFLAQP